MSIFPPFQPIIFEPYLPNECSCNEATFRLFARQSDVCQFQVIVGPCDGVSNVLEDPTFEIVELGPWVLSGGFTLISGDACCTNATGTASQFDNLVIGAIYQCEIITTSIIGTLFVYNGLTEVAQITTTGSTIFTFTAVSQDVSMELQDSAHSVCISTFTAKPLSNEIAFGIIDSGGNTLNVYDVFNSPSFFTFTKDRMTVKFTWSDFDIQDGQCYTIGFADGCSNTNGQFGIFNEDFDNCLTGWSVIPGTIPSITCEFLENPVSGDSENCIEFDNSGTGTIQSFVTTLKIGLFYSITIDAMSTDADGFLRVYTGTTFYDFTLSGENTIQMCTGTGVFKIEAHLQTSSFIRLWGITVRLSNVLDFEFDYQSHPFKIGANECTHLINLSNDDDGLGYVFEGANFAPQIRLESELVNSVPEFIRETYHDNLGKKDVYYGEYRKHFIFNIDYMPTWVFDFLCQCFIADHFFIDGVEYFIEGDTIETNYPENVCYSNMTSVKMEVSIKEQLSRNADIGNAENPVTFGATQVLTDGAGHTITILQTGEAIDIPL